jgi:hypothetical protein
LVDREHIDPDSIVVVVLEIVVIGSESVRAATGVLHG